MQRLREVGSLFLRLGLTAFGGPVAHIALMRAQVVHRRGWVTDDEFLDLIAGTNLIPGPNSTQLAIHLGRHRAGARGMLVAGLAFIVPATLIVLVLAWLYSEYGAQPLVQAALRTVKPVVIAIVVVALIALVRAVAGRRLALPVAAAALVASLLGVDEVLVVIGGGVVRALAGVATRARLRDAAAAFAWPMSSSLTSSLVSAIAPSSAPLALGLAATAASAPITLAGIFGVFLKVGALVYGSGYTLIAYLRGDVVESLGWLTDRQLLDAVAVGQLTPGPLFTTATFVGYLLAGVPGALVATVAIFLPAFVFVALLGPIVRFLRRRPWTAAALDGVTGASLGLMAAVTVFLAGDALLVAGAATVDPLSVVIALLALGGLVSQRIGPGALVVAAALVGVATTLVGVAPA